MKKEFEIIGVSSDKDWRTVFELDKLYQAYQPLFAGMKKTEDSTNGKSIAYFVTRFVDLDNYNKYKPYANYKKDKKLSEELHKKYTEE